MPRLTALTVSRKTSPGKYPDEHGLMLQVTKNRAGDVRKSWYVRYSFAGKRTEMGLGSYPALSLADARDEALQIRRSVHQGIDPKVERDSELELATAEEVEKMTFKDCAEFYLKSRERSWSNSKHRQQWRNTLVTYAYPIIGDMDVRDIGLSEIMQIIEPIWYDKTETASRVRGRMESILAWSIVRGHREGPNPAIWRGHLDVLLPTKSKVQKVKHHAALDWRKLPIFMDALRQRPGTSARALEFTILTASRSGEVRNALWDEILWDDDIWMVPAERMKMRNEHRVPLSRQATALLKRRFEETRGLGTDHIFYPSVPTKPFSNDVYRALYKRMGHDGITTHGFRSSFRDWAGESTNHARETAELALAHKVGDDTERAYRRGDALAKRLILMQDWADYCDGA
ncbi:MAG: integrase arm-type DNA-binding domain-containing protein [Pseudomonadota bacterium]